MDTEKSRAGSASEARCDEERQPSSPSTNNTGLLPPCPAAQAKTISTAKLLANQRNAQHATGPRTARGKDNSRRNALKHGLLAKEVVIRTSVGQEKRADFEELLKALLDDCAPVGRVEEILVEQIAVCVWRMRRVYRCEGAVIRSQLDMLARQTEASRPGAEAPRKKQQFLRASQGKLCLPLPKAAASILRYEASIQKEYYRALHELERLQRRRRGEFVPPPVNADVQLHGGEVAPAGEEYIQKD